MCDELPQRRRIVSRKAMRRAMRLGLPPLQTPDMSDTEPDLHEIRKRLRRRLKRLNRAIANAADIQSNNRYDRCKKRCQEAFAAGNKKCKDIASPTMRQRCKVRNEAAFIKCSKNCYNPGA